MDDKRIEVLAFLNWLRNEVTKSMPGNGGYLSGFSQPQHHEMLKTIARSALLILNYNESPSFYGDAALGSKLK